MIGNWFQLAPIWLLGLLLFLATVACALAGSGLNHWYARHFGSKEELSESQSGYIVSIVYFLLSLLVGLTFQMAVERFEVRRQLVRDDANAIEALYLKAQLLDDPHRSRLSGLLVRYSQNHIDLAQARRDDANGRKLLADDDRLRRELWGATMPAFQSIKNLDFSTSLVESAADVVKVDSDRRAARLPPIPTTIVFVLIFYSLVAATVLGAAMKSRKGEIVSAVMLVFQTLALMLIADINRPVDGTIHESQAPMQQMLQRLQSEPPSTYQQLAARNLAER